MSLERCVRRASPADYQAAGQTVYGHRARRELLSLDEAVTNRALVHLKNG